MSRAISYGELWHTPGWDSEVPNADEKARWRAIEFLISRYGLTRTRLRIIDVGCGRGWLTNLLASYGEAVGIDIDPDSIAAARRLFPTLRFLLHSPATALCDPALRDFDLAVCSEVLEHVPRQCQPQFLADLRRLLRPRGALILTTPRGELWRAWLRQHHEAQPIEAWLSEHQLTRLLSSVGFTVRHRLRAHVPTRPLNFSGRLLRVIALSPALSRRAPETLTRRLFASASIYQVVLAYENSSAF